jgi:hypothetical protein
MDIKVYFPFTIVIFEVKFASLLKLAINQYLIAYAFILLNRKSFNYLFQSICHEIFI